MPRKNIFSPKGGEPKVRKMMVSVPEDVYKILQYRSVETDATMSEIVTLALKKFLGIKEEGAIAKK